MTTKALLITNDFPPVVGGVARWYERICAAVPAGGVVVLAPRTAGDHGFDVCQPYKIVRQRGPTSRRLPARVVQLAILLVRGIATARRERVDAVHIGQLHLAPIGIVARLLQGLPYVLYLHGGEMARYMRFGMVRAVVRRVVRGAALVVVNSEYTRRYFEDLAITNPRTEALTMSVETDRFRPTLDDGGVRARYGLDGQRVILTVSRLDDYKGHDMVIRALNKVKRSSGPIRYVIAGRGPEEARLRALAVDLGCGDDVVFAGHVSEQDLAPLYASCDLFVMPSRPLPCGDFEGFGIVFLEAGACGKPVIGGRSGGVPEAVLDGVTGVLVNPTDVDELSAAITKLLSDREEATRLGMQGRRRTEQLASAWTAAVARIWSL
ncbi:MAG TPA: glycosyltransferase family 4 protein [bacterium]|nr:glycosyltransferase family 4 protein [bacterium]